MSINIDNDFAIVWQKINNYDFYESNNAFRNVKDFISGYPNDVRSKKITNWLNNQFTTAFNNPELLTALYDQNLYKYQRRELIFKNLPFINNLNMLTIFHNLIFCDSAYYGTIANSYEGINHYLMSQGILVNQDIFTKIAKFCNDNGPLMKASANHYDTFEIEKGRLNKLLFGSIPDDYYQFKNDYIYECRINNTDYNETQAYNKYVNQKMSILGEYIMYDRIKAFGNSSFTAKDLGNGFGYDLYFNSINNYTNTRQETLVEVKSTKQNINDTYFELSDNEYQTMLNTINDPDTNYLIFRCFFDVNGKISFKTAQILQYDHLNNCFYSLTDNTIVYRVNSNNPLIYEYKANSYVLKKDS